MAKIVEMCAVLKVLLEAKSRGELMMAPEIGERIGMPAQYAGPLLGIMYERKLVEKPDEKEKRYQISPKGEGFLANPPPETVVKKKTPPVVPPVPPPAVPLAPPPAVPPVPPPAVPLATPVAKPVTGTEQPEGGKVVFPSQADTFSSIGETLGFEKGVGDQKKPSLESVVEYVRRLANMDDLDSIESVLTECGLSADIRKRWLRLYALTLPAKKAIISPELKVRLGLEEGGEKPKPPQQMFNVVEGKIYPEPDGEYTFAKAVQKVAAEKTSADPAALITAIMPILTKESSTDSAAVITALMPLLTKEPPPQDTTLFQSLQTRIEQLADERNKAQLDALRAEMKSGQRPPEADAQIEKLSTNIETLREELHKQQLARIQEQHDASLNLLTDKIAHLEKEIQASIQGKQVDSKYGLMGEIGKGILNEIGGARRDIKEIAPTFLQRGKERTVRTPEQKASFDQGIEQAIEKQKKSLEMGDELFQGKES